MERIRDLFSTTRPLDRRIEKVIDYAATEESRLLREISEYEVTAAVEKGMERFLDAFDEGVRSGNVAEMGVWVSGFYGSGKSSFTKYLGFALDARRSLGGKPFVDHLGERLNNNVLRAHLKTVAKRANAAVFMLDLATSQFADTAAASVSRVLWRHVLTTLGYSKEPKVAELELRLDQDGRLDEFRSAHNREFKGRGRWDEIHSNAHMAVLRASKIVPKFLPEEYPTSEAFATLQYTIEPTVEEMTARVWDLVRRKTGCQSVVFFVDEVGQYVAPRQELILNVDGLVRSFKEVGRGKAWFVATAQQTLTETSESAARNSPELFKLQARFPLSIELEATDIREITSRRLLTKTPDGNAELKRRFVARGETLRARTHLVDWPGGAAPYDGDKFADLYPFLPMGFDLVLDLIRSLARRTGGTGLRSAIRLVQDILVDASRVLPAGIVPFAERPIGRIVDATDLFDTLRGDLAKEHPQAVQGVDRVSTHPKFSKDALAIRVAKAVAVLQSLENRPRTAANIAALLCNDLDGTDDARAVEVTLQSLVESGEFGLVELRADAGATGGTGFVFLSDEVQPLQKKRDGYQPTKSEIDSELRKIMARVFDPLPATRLEGNRPVEASIYFGKARVAGEDGEIDVLIEACAPAAIDERLAAIERDSQRADAPANVIHWLFMRSEDADDRVGDALRSAYIQTAVPASRDGVLAGDVARYLRAELRRAERYREAATDAYRQALSKGWFVFRGLKRPVQELGTLPGAAASRFLDDVAKRVFHHFALVKRNVSADVAAKFLESERLDRIPADRDPLSFVKKQGGKVGVDVGNPAVQGALAAFRQLVAETGAGRVQGTVVLEHFHRAPYGWSKDTTRYVFAALLVAGEIQIHSADLVLKTPGPKAVEAVRNTQAFGRVGIAPRDERVPLDALDRASRRLEELFAVEVLPLEDQISRAVRQHVPQVVERIASLPDRLRLLGLSGDKRARETLQTCTELLRGDASGAASVLGAANTAFPGDVQWARTLVEALDAGREREVMEARKLVDAAREIAETFPPLRNLLALPSTIEVGEILASDSVQERAANLRVATRALDDALLAAATHYRELLEADATAVIDHLSVEPGWVALGSAGQSEIETDIREACRASDAGDAPQQLRRTVMRRLAFGASVSNWQARVQQAEADARTTPVDDAPRATGGPTAATHDLMFADFLPDEPIATIAELDRWLAELRARLTDQLDRGPVRLIVKS